VISVKRGPHGSLAAEVTVHEEDHMRRYEQIYILRPTLSEEEIDALLNAVNEIITNDRGTIIFHDKWGMKKLAYPIEKQIQGYYVYTDFAGIPQSVKEIERRFRIDDSVLKYLTVKLQDSITDEEIASAQAEAKPKAPWEPEEKPEQRPAVEEDDGDHDEDKESPDDNAEA
jgi:small subunit ribosomal protein S6